jgi:hypothetical protein
MELRQRRIRRSVASPGEVVGRALLVWLVPSLLVIALSVLIAGRA